MDAGGIRKTGCRGTLNLGTALCVIVLAETPLATGRARDPYLRPSRSTRLAYLHSDATIPDSCTTPPIHEILRVTGAWRRARYVSTVGRDCRRMRTCCGRRSPRGRISPGRDAAMSCEQRAPSRYA